jgi:hypothetical protein
MQRERGKGNKMNLPEEPTWAITDATKIQALMKCRRKYFFEYVLGWRPDTPSVHLIWGSAWHRVMEVLYEKGFSSEVAAEAFKSFEAEYRETFPPTWDDGNKPKVPFNALRAIPQYMHHYSRDEDEFEVLHIEVAGTVAVSTTKSLHFKTDTIMRNQDGKVLSMEHKTSKSFNHSWANQWRQKFQVGTYNHVLNSMYDPDEVYGVLINGFFVSNPPQMKKNGEPYANAKDNEFHRVPVRMNMDSMNAWLNDAMYYIEETENEFQKLSETKEEDAIMKAFPRNREACADFGTCPFLDYCCSWHNPIQHAEEPPLGYHVEHWDPSKRDHVKEIVNL